jgi:hypothetical protein
MRIEFLLIPIQQLLQFVAYIFLKRNFVLERSSDDNLNRSFCLKLNMKSQLKQIGIKVIFKS